MRALRVLLVGLSLLGIASGPLAADDLPALARDFWAWRASQQPASGDDIPRIERPANWTPDWSSSTVRQRRQELAAFKERLGNLDSSRWPVNEQVDYRLLRSALARVEWELNYTRNWQRDPNFYVDQTLGAIFELLLAPTPFGAARSGEIVRRLESIPRTVTEGEQNLETHSCAPFARVAIASLEDVRARMEKFSHALKPRLAAESRERFEAAVEKATAALDSYREWLKARLPSMSAQTAVGRDAYVFFLRNVALIPYSPEELLAIGRAEWARAVAFQTYEEHRDAGLPELRIFPDQASQINAEAQDEIEMRRYLAAKQILTVPDWIQHYTNRPLPDYLAPLADQGVTDDLTGPGRLKDEGIHYIPPPSRSLGYFDLATARDPMVMIAHEGIPGHYFQLVLSWANPDPIRRHYYDSGANEGIGFYAEELMLEAGLFDRRLRSREIIYNFMRLRALRVEVDVKLALGEFTTQQAADYLRQTVPMDSRTALAEASSFAATPGQAISYQIGKYQILKLLADAQRTQGRQFDLQKFHDFVWGNGNVPIALDRWEFLGDRGDVDALDKLK